MRSVRTFAPADLFGKAEIRLIGKSLFASVIGSRWYHHTSFAGD